MMTNSSNIELKSKLHNTTCKVSRFKEQIKNHANEIENVEYPKDGDNTDDRLFSYSITDECKREDIDDDTSVASEIFKTDYFYL